MFRIVKRVDFYAFRDYQWQIEEIHLFCSLSSHPLFSYLRPLSTCTVSFKVSAWHFQIFFFFALLSEFLEESLYTEEGWFIHPNFYPGLCCLFVRQDRGQYASCLFAVSCFKVFLNGIFIHFFTEISLFAVIFMSSCNSSFWKNWQFCEGKLFLSGVGGDFHFML